MAATQVPPVQPFSIGVVPDRELVAVVPAGELDLSCAGELDREVRDLRRVGFDRVVVDLRQLRFMDSTGLRVLLGLRNDAQSDGYELTLRPGPPAVQRVFELTATHELFVWRSA